MQINTITHDIDMQDEARAEALSLALHEKRFALIDLCNLLAQVEDATSDLGYGEEVDQKLREVRGIWVALETARAEIKSIKDEIGRLEALSSITTGTLIALSHDGGRTWSKPRPVAHVSFRGYSRRHVPYVGLSLADVDSLRDGAVWSWLGITATANDLGISIRVEGTWEWSMLASGAEEPTSDHSPTLLQEPLPCAA